MRKKIILVSGGEYGDIYGARLAAALKNIRPSVNVKRMEGIKWRGADGHPAGVLKKELAYEKVDCIVLMDQPCLDPHFIKQANIKGITVIDYAGSNSGSLKTGQLKKLTYLLDMALAVFPFEVPLFEEAYIDVEFVGHPLVDIVDTSMSRGEARDALGFDPTDVPVTLIPGGKKSAARSLLRLMVKGVKEAAEVSKLQVKLIIPDSEKYDKNLLNELTNISHGMLTVLKGQRHMALRASEAAVVSAGTVTLEATLTGTPMLILQQTSALSNFMSNIMKSFVLYGLPNIILDEPLCPELVRNDITQKKIMKNAVRLLEGGTREEIDKGLAEVREKLGPPGTIKRAAEAILRTIEKAETGN
ncbi:MAG: lipid-A-disaccharide synthase [Thermodesulfobacteriota bacterium]|nr:MAG: lipid-A-disaccharide synthase [Thermodesulfobacteriota bacterium]